ncbi:hypothetical protein ACFQ3N_19390 [Virgibacillus byunsanensis]|uniref:Uncharacterized protein n=1 Tax=Virgibacillus byunsanensis TaxID=570945 RepID=A0ABW3LQ39_9BACI
MKESSVLVVDQLLDQSFEQIDMDTILSRVSVATLTNLIKNLYRQSLQVGEKGDVIMESFLQRNSWNGLLMRNKNKQKGSPSAAFFYIS